MATFCPFTDPVIQRKCSDFPDATSRNACELVYDCMLRTECAVNASPQGAGAIDCYCGAADPRTCKDGNGTGVCRAEIEAAFNAASGNLVVVDANSIYG